MNGNGEYDEMSDRDSIRKISEEYQTAYNALDPQGKMEADIQRAFRLICLCTDSESLSPEIQSRFADWFMEYGDQKYVEEAFFRYLDHKTQAEMPETGVKNILHNALANSG